MNWRYFSFFPTCTSVLSFAYYFIPIITIIVIIAVVVICIHHFKYIFCCSFFQHHHYYCACRLFVYGKKRNVGQEKKTLQTKQSFQHVTFILFACGRHTPLRPISICESFIFRRFYCAHCSAVSSHCHSALPPFISFATHKSSLARTRPTYYHLCYQHIHIYMREMPNNKSRWCCLPDYLVSYPSFNAMLWVYLRRHWLCRSQCMHYVLFFICFYYFNLNRTQQW